VIFHSYVNVYQEGKWEYMGYLYSQLGL
jgi:hypothetical protein